ncbi:MAG TPA: rhamnogalacturonan acetylesterase [Candidatus Dormibacteraeota bacterium]|nr:rhamnogalacturonan acetylesterase [Candidatus Dormibacteraeota bacterium]
MNEMLGFSYSFKPNFQCKYDVKKGYGFARSPDSSMHEDLRDSWAGDYFLTPVPTLLMDVPNGNYRVRLTLGSSNQPSVTTVKEGLGHLKMYDVRTEAGKFITKQFSVHINDGQLKLAFDGSSPAVQHVKVMRQTNIPTIFLAGDSTVTDQSSGKFPYTGWGQMLSFFMDGNIAVSNHAGSGLSSKSFVNEGRLNRIAKTLRKGDYLFVQFAHNDEKDNRNGTDPFTTYQHYLQKYIDLARSVEAYPVFIAPMHRRFFNMDGSIENTHGDYIEAMQQLAMQESVPFVDLAALSKRYIEELGPEDSKRIFLWAKPGQYENLPEGAKDNTHFSELGALELARLVAKGIQEAEIEPLKNHLLSNKMTMF